ncbi:pyroglutamyl-peptidase 1-like isoform X2 [Tigriopus californicus]|uniref:pyroglutamyl-peptidase 1-like isoform X2 n=1 Tax=Tigriopus californicus TaxID=6832 RepID=UPI0027DA6EA4|nr:pyroglutamyl-peptidase 1-like isoform X2 [Tigriopus californicus]
MEPSSQTLTKPYLIVTGFGPFGPHEKNPSWDAVQALHGKWDNEQKVPASLECVQGCHARTKSPLAIVHVGVGSSVKKITIETEAKNCGYNIPDVNQKCPPNEECCEKGSQTLKTTLNVEQIVAKINGSEAETGIEAELSTSAGGYLCEFIFYKSLAASNGTALFVHVPDYNKPYSVDQMGKALQIICETLIPTNTIRD